LFIAIGVFLAAFPLYWMFVIASTDDSMIFSETIRLYPGSQLMHNIHEALNQENVYFADSIVNSLIVTTIVTISVLLLSSLAGFAFAKLRFKGKNVLFFFLIATLTIPPSLGIIALYIMMGKLGWVGHLSAVIVPGLVSAFSVFYMRQFIEDAIPDELVESARVDGASTFRLFWSIVMPALRPAFGVLGLLTAVGVWNDFQWPLFVLGQSDNPTVQVSLSNMASGQFVVYSNVFAGSVLATVPLLILFFIAGKQIVAGIMEGAVKG
jgi:cellobiose transport system permease protein